MTEIELIKGLKQHNESAIEEIMDKYSPYVTTVISNVSRGSLSTADIEEAAADVFFALWNNAENIREGYLCGYLAAIAKSKAHDKLRKTVQHGKLLDLEDVVLADEYSIQDNLDQQVMQKDIRDALDLFDEPDREIIIRYYYYYQTSPEISGLLGLNNETVKSKIKRARTKLKAFFTERGYHYENK